jgi:pimeloyl-ACP methyl ester carboxylesterase
MRLTFMTLVWFLSVGLLPAQDFSPALPPGSSLTSQALRQSTHAESLRALAVQGCPTGSPGLLNSVSVPVGQPLDLVVLSGPAPAGGINWQVSSDNPAIVAAGNPVQGFLPTVFTPAGQTFSSIFTVFGISVGQTLLRITNLTSGGSGTTPLGAWDVNPTGSTKFLDANPPTNHCRQSDTSATLSSDPTALAACGTSVRGVATDGISQLLLRTTSGLPGTGCFEISSSSALDQGSLQTAVAPTQGPIGGLDYSFSFYKAPGEFGNNLLASRTVQITFYFTPNIGNGNQTSFQSQLTIIRPPLMLLHGIWSDMGAWSSFYLRNDAFHTTSAADYTATHDASFSTNIASVKDFVARPLTDTRAKGYAVTQADVIGHSMGGLLTRLYIGSQNYLRPDTFNKGDIHHLITLDTPHYGTSFANLLVALHRAKPTETEQTVSTIIPTPGARATNGAVCDLSENSPALQALSGGTSISSQVTTATAGPAGIPTGGLYWGGVLGSNSFEGALTASRCVQRNLLFQCTQRDFTFPQDIVNSFRFRESNDAIVPLSSQQGGLTGVNYPTLLHFGAAKWGATLVAGPTNTQQVATQVLQLLDGPVTNFASAFPGVLSNGTGTPRTVPGRGTGLDQQDYANQCGSGGPLKLNAFQGSVDTAADSMAPQLQRRISSLQTGDTRLTVSSPGNGQQFSPGDSVVVTVQLVPPLVANDIGIDLIGLKHLEGTNYNGTSYQATFTIPDYYAGPLVVIPAITDSFNNPIIGIPLTIAVRPPTPLSIALIQHNYPLVLPPSRAEQLKLIGVYPNNVQRDITSSQAGTTYQSSNQAVVTIDAEGTFQALSSGTATITATNGGFTDYATFEVNTGSTPLPPQDLTGQVQVQPSGFVLNRQTGFYVQTVVITNMAEIPTTGPLYFVIGDLPAGVTLINKSGLTQTIVPTHSPFLGQLSLPGDGLTFQPGQSISLQLQFLNAGRVRISYTPKLYRASVTP